MQYLSHLRNVRAKQELEEVEFKTANKVAGLTTVVKVFNYTRETIHVHTLNGELTVIRPVSDVDFSGKVVVRTQLSWSDNGCLKRGELFTLPVSELTEAQAFKKRKILQAADKQHKSTQYDQTTTLREIEEGGGLVVFPGANTVVARPDIHIRQNDWAKLLGLELSEYSDAEIDTAPDGWFICGIPEAMGVVNTIRCMIPTIGVVPIPVIETDIFRPGLHIVTGGRSTTTELDEVQYVELSNEFLIGDYGVDYHSSGKFVSCAEIRVSLNELAVNKANSIDRAADRALDINHKEATHRQALSHNFEMAEDKLNTQSAINDLKIDAEERTVALKGVTGAVSFVKGVLAGK